MRTNLFTLIDDSYVVLRSGGVLRETEAYSCTLDKEDTIYARVGTGFIKLLKHGNMTSKPNTTWEYVLLNDNLSYDYNSTGVMVAANA